MKNIISYSILVAGIILLFCVCHHDIDYYINREFVESSIDGKLYPVVGSFDGEKNAANLLAKINEFLINVLKHLKKKYLTYDGGNWRQKQFVYTLLEGYNPDVLIENNPRGTKNTSYVAGKGDEVGFCLREKQSGENAIHNFQTMQFVALHELAHIATYEYGHGEEFWSNFKFLIYEAADAGLYFPINYSKYPIMYCGVSISYSPYHDSTLPLPF